MGEYSITLNEIKYLLKINTNVIASYENMHGSDFMADTYSAIEAMVRANEFKANPSLYAKILCSSVTRKQAATLIYLAAKESNSQVEFEEIQEALLVDHELADEKFHPAIFTTLALFAINGKACSKDKKKESSSHG